MKIKKLRKIKGLKTSFEGKGSYEFVDSHSFYQGQHLDINGLNNRNFKILRRFKNNQTHGISIEIN